MVPYKGTIKCIHHVAHDFINLNCCRVDGMFELQVS